MRAYLAYLKITLRLTMRDRLVLFFNYLFPLVFFIGFGEGFGARSSGGAASQVLSMVLMFGVLGTGFFGAGMRATIERETGILRRFKVAPITPGPILAAGIITGWLLFLPAVFLFLALGHWRYGMPWPTNLLSLLIIISAGVISFRSIGMIIAATVNSMAESQIIIQLLYLPMLMLSGATVPLSVMPEWLQTVAQFLPSTHLYLGMQGVLVRGETVAQNLESLGGLLLATVVGCLLSMKLFRWEKEEKLKPSAKLWVLAALAPFLLIGAWQIHSRTNLNKTKQLARQMRRSQSWLIRDARIFTGTGKVIESGAILIKGGRIAQIFEGASPDARSLNAEPIEANGKTVIPGLIDASVTLMLPGTGAPDMQGDRLTKAMERALAAYLYCGITAVASAPDPQAIAGGLEPRLASGELLGADLLLRPQPLPTLSLVAAEIEAGNPAIVKDNLLQQVLTPAQMAQVRALAARFTPRTAAHPLPTPDSIPASRSGLPLLAHGPVLHHELQLWVEAGMAPRDVLLAATSKAAAALGIADRTGSLTPGREATLVIVEGNPLEDIAATERIWFVLFKGEHVQREELLKVEKDSK
ncbi:ABC transporter permease [uncultured Desulfobulbus sp.]|uniref:ABC transporter permease n=1 Tax=uncultured Desulfobulbus sp. TaxID=239745 RepID=UPI0029C9A4C0|nr:ABC transporter permease [uncultured Desulfobulbus sp.]